MRNLDSTDRRIIGALRAQGRLPNSELAAKVGLSASACLRRVKILEDRGIIRGYAAIVSPIADDDTVVAIVRITLDKQTEDHLRRFEEAVLMHPEIDQCFLMTGEADYLLHLRTTGAAAYEPAHKEILSRLPGVARINTSFAIRSVLGAPPS